MTTMTAGELQSRTRSNLLIDRFIPRGDVDECHEILVRAPAHVVLEEARRFDFYSIPAVRGIFWLRARFLNAHDRRSPVGGGFVSEALAMGWGMLVERPGRELLVGAVCRPWIGDVRFRAIAPPDFADFFEPDLVKIVWTVEVEPVKPRLTLLRTRTRAVATDDCARRKFRAYWRKFGAGVIVIRWLLLPAIRREAERRQRAIDAGEARGVAHPL